MKTLSSQPNAITAMNAASIHQFNNVLSRERRRHTGAIRNGSGLGVEVQAERHESTNGTSQVEDNPEHADRTTFLTFRRVSYHDVSLGNPQERCSDTENGSGCDDECSVAGVYESGEEKVVQSEL
jgi:hypothetical protein